MGIELKVMFSKLYNIFVCIIPNREKYNKKYYLNKKELFFKICKIKPNQIINCK